MRIKICVYVTYSQSDRMLEFHLAVCKLPMQTYSLCKTDVQLVKNILFHIILVLIHYFDRK